ncbi:hypothetical protein KFK09_016421 [Dendrobium nobile]|uniref:E3 ubiquitin-protein ligase RMA n=1 Tax=Dendrobium nobile TaxID=94219 RepID=A0A8T3AXZ2_DENNO|nr:hypothetical protein KFK09_016421 [Dendrobium nobile]
MTRDLGESTSSGSPNSSIPANDTNSNDAGSFECNICFELAQDPIVTLCGHLYCWLCLYQWLHDHAQSSECPVCKAFIEEDKLVPLYGRGKVSMDPRSKSNSNVNIPHRPVGQRPATAQRPALPPPHSLNQFAQMNPWFMGGTPMGGARFGNYTFSAVIGGLFPLLNFQVHGFPDATSYGPVAGFPYGYPHAFHGVHAYGYPRQVAHGLELISRCF